MRELLSWTGSAWIATVPDAPALHNLRAAGAVVCPMEGLDGISALLVVGPNHERLPYSSADRRLIQDSGSEIGAILRRSETYKRDALCDHQAAQAILDRMTPANSPNVEGIECFGQCERSGNLGGDFFDIARLISGGLLVVAGTLNLEGMVGAILLTGLQTRLRSRWKHEEELGPLNEEMNKILCDIAPENACASVFSAFIDAPRRRLHYINAGDQAALLIRTNGTARRIEPSAAVLGLSRGSKYKVRTAEFAPGDTLIAASDGITEAQGPMGARFGDHRILQVLKKHADSKVHEVAGELISSVQAFTAERTDATSTDRTVVLARYTPCSHSMSPRLNAPQTLKLHASAGAA
ncbi:MAG: serine/threonine-protein phosphatase [Acidobacteriota bacterium]|nr:serine/threonine-protein phosphatase [Acidobacteriota bacterium]